jgi:hypothetical protein
MAAVAPKVAMAALLIRMSTWPVRSSVEHRSRHEVGSTPGFADVFDDAIPALLVAAVDKHVSPALGE